MGIENNSNQLQERLQMATSELQDAHLVIGQQQVQLLRQQQILQQMQQRIMELEAQVEQVEPAEKVEAPEV